MKYYISFFWLLISLLSFNNSIASLVDEELSNHDQQSLKSSSLLQDMNVQSVEESFSQEQRLLKSFPPLLDMGEDIVIKALNFVLDCDKGSIEPEKNFYFISSLEKNIIESIRQKENHSQFQYFFITVRKDVLDTLELVENFKENLNLNLDNQIKVIMFCPLGLQKSKIEFDRYSNLTLKQNMISFILQYSWYNGQIFRACCPLGVSIDIPFDKHHKGFRLSKLNPFDSRSGRSQSEEQILRDIYEKVLYRWNFRMNGIENGAFRDEDDALNKIGVYSANTGRDRLIAFLGGYKY